MISWRWKARDEPSSSEIAFEVHISDLESPVCDAAYMAELAYAYADRALTPDSMRPGYAFLSNEEADHIMFALIQTQVMIRKLKTLYFEVLEGPQPAKAADEQPPIAPH